MTTVAIRFVSKVLIAGASIGLGMTGAGAASTCVVKDFYAQSARKNAVNVMNLKFAVRAPAAANSPEQRGAGVGGSNYQMKTEERRAHQIRAAVHSGDLAAFTALLPEAENERKRVLRNSNALFTAFHEGGLAIVKQIIAWDEAALPALTKRNGIGVLNEVLTGWALEARSNGRGAVASPRELEFVALVRLLLASETLAVSPEDWGSALANIAYIPPSPEVNEFAATFLARGASIERRDAYQRTALRLAAEAKNTELVRRMLQTQTPSQAVLDEAIVWAPLSENAAVLALLLETGANVNADAARFGKSTIHYPAAEAAGMFRFSGTREPIALFIQHKVDPNRLNPSGVSALMIVMHDHELMGGLLELGANANQQTSDGDTPLLLATRIPTQVLRRKNDTRQPNQIEPGLDPEMRRKSVALLLQYGADPKITNKAGVTPLMQTTSEDAGSVELLAAKGGTINLPQYAAFYNQTANDTITGAVSSALLHGNDTLAAILLSREPKIAPEDCGAVYYAAQTGGTRTLAALLDRKADVYAGKSDDGKTPLHIAAASGQLAAVKLLLDRRAAMINESTPAAINLCGGHGPSLPCLHGRKTALMYAAEAGYTSVAEELIKRGADINRTDFSGTTALGYANRTNEDVTKLLKAHGAR